MPNTLERLRNGELMGSTRLDLSCDLRALPHEVFELADTLEVLNLSGNQLASLPDLSRLKRLRVLFCSQNNFSVLPEHLSDCPALTMVGFKSNQIQHVPASSLPRALQWLILTDNQIDALPEAIGGCTQLEKLALAGNHLRTLPDHMRECRELGLLRISANRLEHLPEWLCELPKLAWLAFAGNPMDAHLMQPPEHAHMWPDIAWQDLHIHELLGQGASGHIYAATPHPASSQSHSALAVKVFKGEMTSDGLPELEMQTCLQAGAHPHLIPVLGRLRNHPTAQPGLVMPRLDPSWRPLANPPSLATCTRDVYATDAQFELDTVLRLAQAVASAAAHLHAQGVMHGDLYAHNILWREPGDAYLGDFGAASFLPTNPQHAQALQRLEVLAYGHLLGECLARVAPAAHSDPRWQRLSTWQARCTAAAPHARPLLREVAEDLRA